MSEKNTISSDASDARLPDDADNETDAESVACATDCTASLLESGASLLASIGQESDIAVVEAETAEEPGTADAGPDRGTLQRTRFKRKTGGRWLSRLRRMFWRRDDADILYRHIGRELRRRRNLHR